MFKLVVKIILLGLLVLIFGGLLKSHFIDTSQYSFSKGAYERLENNIDIGFFGSSHSYAAYNPAIFEVELKKNAFNFGGSARRLITSLPVMEEIIEENDLELAVVDIFSMSLGELDNENSIGLQYQSFDNTDFSFTKLITFFSVFGYNDPLDIFPIIRNHDYWKKMFDQKKVRFLSDHSEFYNGYFTSRRFIENDTWIKFSDKVSKRNAKLDKDSIFILDKRQIKLIEKVISKFEDQNIPLLFVSSPSYYYGMDKSYTMQQNAIREYLTITKGLRFVDFNLLKDSLNFTKYDFKDPNHLNVNGGIKVSKYLTELIKKNFDLGVTSFVPNPYNRYEYIESDFSTALYAFKISSKIKKKTGIKNVYLIRSYKNRYEILFELNPGSKRNVHIKMGYLNLDKEVQWKYALLRKKDQLAFKGRTFAIYQFDTDIYLKNLDHFKLYVGPERNILVADSMSINLD